MFRRGFAEAYHQYHGRTLRLLTLIDEYTRECLAIESDQRLKGGDVVLVLSRIKVQ
jgi:putative transposase